MPPVDPKKSGPREMVTTSGVRVLVNDPPPYVKQEVEPPTPFEPSIPTAIVFPPGQSLAERNAFTEQLEQQWGPFIRSKLRERGVPYESTRDLAQEAIVIVMNKHEELRGPPARVTAYVEGVVDHLVQRRWEKKRPEAAPDSVLEARPDSAPSPESAASDAELWQKLAGYIDRLSPAEAEVIQGRMVGAAFEVIATALGRSVSTVHDQYTRGMQNLRDMALASERGGARLAGRNEKSYGRKK